MAVLPLSWWWAKVCRTANFSLGGPDIRRRSGAPGLAHEPPARQGWKLFPLSLPGILCGPNPASNCKIHSIGRVTVQHFRLDDDHRAGV